MQCKKVRFWRHGGAAAGNCARLIASLSRCALGCLALCLCVAAAAVEMNALYTVEVPLDPADPEAQNLAFEVALGEVLVRVTGTTAVIDSGQMATLFPDPRTYVSQYRPGPDSTLVISLEGSAIVKVLRQAGAPIWDSERPLTLMWIAVDWGQGDREIVAADDQDRLPEDARSIDRNRMLRERITDVASQRGIPVSFPLLDIEDLESISFSDIWGGFDDLLLQASMRYEAESVLVGRIRPESLQEDRWTWFHAGRRTGWYGEPEEMIQRLADSLAAQYAIIGRQPFDTIHLTISGIRSVSAFGRVQQLMENLRGVQAVMLNAVDGDRIVYEVQVQGGPERLQRALELSDLLDLVDQFDDVSESNRYDIPVRQRYVLEYLYRSG